LLQSNTNSYFAAIEECGHFLPDEQPEKVARRLMDFFEICLIIIMSEKLLAQFLL